MTTIKEQCAEAGISYGGYYYRRRNRGMSHEEALSAPLHLTYMRAAPSCGGKRSKKDLPRVQRAREDVVRTLRTEGTLTLKDIRKRLPQHTTPSIQCAVSALREEGIVERSGHSLYVYYRLTEGKR